MEILTNKGEIHFSGIALDREKVKDVGVSFFSSFLFFWRGQNEVF